MKLLDINKLRNISVAFFTLIILTFSGTAKAEKAPEEHAEEEHGGEFQAGEMIMHHITDSHIWEFWHGANWYLPVILYDFEEGVKIFSSKNFVTHGGEYMGYEIHHDDIHSVEGNKILDISITKNVAMMLISTTLLIVIFLITSNQYKKNKKAPKGVAALLEPVVLYVRDEIARPSIGHKYEKFMPFLLTIFFYILVNNLLGLFPGAGNVTGNIAVTMTLALFTFIMTNINGTKDYWRHIFNTPGVPWWLKFLIPIMPIVEFIGLFTKPFSLMIRLFANITAGHIIILSIISLIFIFESVFISPVSILLGAFMNILELLVAFIQAYVFTLLSALYFGGAAEEHEHEHGQEELQESKALV